MTLFLGLCAFMMLFGVEPKTKMSMVIWMILVLCLFAACIATWIIDSRTL